MSACDQLVCLQGGLVVPVAAYNLALTCEALGIRLSARGSVLDVDGPHTVELLEALRQSKHHILAILKYTPSDLHLFDPSKPFPVHGPIVELPDERSAHGQPARSDERKKANPVKSDGGSR